MKCCVCLDEFNSLVHDGRCSEGYCLKCFGKLKRKCPNCRQTFPWCEDGDSDEEEYLLDCEKCGELTLFSL